MNAMMEIKDNEVLFIYNSDKFRDREALGYAKAIKKYKLKELDVKKDNITEQQFLDLTYRLKIPPIDLFDEQSQTYQENMKGVKLDKEDIVKAVKRTPSLLKTPILVLQDDAFFVESPYALVRKGLVEEGIKPDVDKVNKPEK